MATESAPANTLSASGTGIRAAFSCWIISTGQTLREIGKSRWESAGWILMLTLLVGFCPLAIRRAALDRGSDVPEFYAAGKHVLDHAARAEDTLFYYYLPSLDAAWAALAWMPLPVAALVHYVIEAAAWLALLAAVSRYLLADCPGRVRRQVVLATGLLVLPLVLDHLCLGPFHLLMTCWLVAGLGRVSEGRWKSGGFLLGLAIWIKLLPAVAAAYLLWKGKWKPALVAGISAGAVNVALCLAAYGPVATVTQHQKWWRDQAQGVTARIFLGRGIVLEQRTRNQSLAATMRRALSSEPAWEMGKGMVRYSNLPLSPEQVRTIYQLSQASLLLLLAWLFKRPAGSMSRLDWAADIGIICLSTTWLSPVVWSYHHVVAAPAIALIMAHRGACQRDGWILGIAWLIAVALIGSPTVRAYGGMLGMSAALGVALVWASRAAAESTLDFSHNAARPSLPERSKWRPAA